MDFWTPLFVVLIALWVAGLTAGVVVLWRRLRRLERKMPSRRRRYRNPSAGKEKPVRRTLKLRLRKVENEIEELQEVKDIVEQINAGRVTSQRASKPKHAEGGRADKSAPPSKEDIVKSYNRVLDEKLDRHEFEKSHSPTRIGVSNARERFGEENVAPKIEEMSKGRYWLIGHGDKHLVVPRPSGVIKEGDWREGAFQRLFECGQLSKTGKYIVQKLEHPGIVRPAGDGSWRVKEKGQLQLQEYS